MDKIWIRDQHPGSATLPLVIKNALTCPPIDNVERQYIVGYVLLSRQQVVPRSYKLTKINKET
jgi:hypothetical protein